MPKGESDLYQDIIISGDEAWRIKRIDRVIGYICALSDHYGNDTLLSKIVELDDHKGLLTVTWNSAPSDGEKEIISKAWCSQIGDGNDLVEHQLT